MRAYMCVRLLQCGVVIAGVRVIHISSIFYDLVYVTSLMYMAAVLKCVILFPFIIVLKQLLYHVEEGGSLSWRPYRLFVSSRHLMFRQTHIIIILIVSWP